MVSTTPLGLIDVGNMIAENTKNRRQEAPLIIAEAEQIFETKRN